MVGVDRSTHSKMRLAILFALIRIDYSVCGQDFRAFVATHAKPIENYIMAGYGKGWENCDILSIISKLPKTYQLFNSVHFVMDMDEFDSVDINSLLAPSTCILIISEAVDNATIARLAEAGKSVIQHKRIGLLLRLGPNTSLGALNSTKMPFLVGAQLEMGTSQFLCPTPGSYEPISVSEMCQQPYTSYKNKYIRVGFHDSFKPYGFFNTLTSKADGIEARFMELVQDRMNFKANFTFFKSDKTAFQLVITSTLYN